MPLAEAAQTVKLAIDHYTPGFRVQEDRSSRTLVPHLGARCSTPRGHRGASVRGNLLRGLIRCDSDTKRMREEDEMSSRLESFGQVPFQPSLFRPLQCDSDRRKKVYLLCKPRERGDMLSVLINIAA